MLTKGKGPQQNVHSAKMWKKCENAKNNMGITTRNAEKCEMRVAQCRNVENIQMFMNY